MMHAESDGVNDVVRNIMESMINYVVKLHSGNAPKSATGATATTATTGDVPPARILLQVPPRNATERPAVRQLTPAHVPMSEEVGEVLFSQGYDSDGLIAEYHPEQDLIELENYSKVEIRLCGGDAVPELAPAIAASRFVLIADSEIKN